MNKIRNLLTAYGLEKLLHNSGDVFIRRILGMGLSFIWVYAITNLFGKETYGLISISQVVINFIGVFFCLGLDTAIVKLGSMKKHFNGGVLQSDFLKKAFFVLLFSSLVSCFLMFALKEWLVVNVFKKEELLSYFTLISFFSFLFITHRAFVRFPTVQENFTKYGNYYFLFPNIGILLFVVSVYYFNLEPQIIILGYILSYGIFGIIQLLSLLKIPSNIKHKVKYGALLKLSSPMMISSSFLFISNWIDVLMLGAMVDEGQVGIYNVAFKIGSLLLLVIATVNTVLAPKISKLFENNNIIGIKNEVHKATKIITYLALPSLVLIIVFSNSILRFFGEGFVAGQNVLIIVALGMLFNSLSGSVGQVLNMTGFQRQFQNFTIISAIVNIILNYFLIKKYGIEGAAFASLISNLLINILCILLVKRKFNFYAFIKI